MSFAQANHALTDMTRQARARRDWHRENGQGEEKFITGLIHAFRAEAPRHPVGAGSVHMALSLVRLVGLEDRIAQLTDSLRMRDEALEIAWSRVDELEGEGEDECAP